MVSIIITAYNNPNYIHDCLKSVIDSAKNIDYEILLGIDSCELTLKSVMEKYNEYENLRLFFFEQRNGTYTLKNTLFTQSKYDNIIFFDSDDLMTKNMVQDVLHFLSKDVDLVKPMSFIFENEIDLNSVDLNKKRNTYGEGVFGIKKSVFSYLNGFEPWVCAADTEFQFRVSRNKYKVQYSPRICFLYRVHQGSLTSTKETGFKSAIRQRYSHIIRQKMKSNTFEPLTELHTAKNIEVTPKNYDNFRVYKITDEEFYKQINEIEESRLMVIQNIFGKEPRKVVEKSYQKNEPKIIDVFKFKPNRNLKREEERKNLRNESLEVKKNQSRQILTSNSQTKTNRRVNLPNINLRLP
jgi:glycosyltransferase involved in cell wall biosynthesis